MTAKVTIPILCAALGFSASTLLDHETRISVMEANSYTHKDAELGRREITRAIEALKKDIPPDWFRKKVDEIGTELRDMRNEVTALRAKVEALEKQ